MFAALDTLLAATLSQVGLYNEIGQLVSGRSEKGAVIAAAEYLHNTYPDVSGFSPEPAPDARVFHIYESTPEWLADAWRLGNGTR